MKDFLIYENPEHTIQLKIVKIVKQDMFGFELPKKTIKTVIDDKIKFLDLVKVEHITK